MQRHMCDNAGGKTQSERKVHDKRRKNRESASEKYQGIAAGGIYTEGNRLLLKTSAAQKRAGAVKVMLMRSKSAFSFPTPHPLYNYLTI